MSAYLEPARNVERRLEVDRRVENDQRVVAELHLRYRCIAAAVRTVYVAVYVALHLRYCCMNICDAIINAI
jgi:hypothetical protein